MLNEREQRPAQRVGRMTNTKEVEGSQICKDVVELDESHLLVFWQAPSRSTESRSEMELNLFGVVRA